MYKRQALKSASDGTKNALENISDAIATAVKWIINCAPFGIMGLIFTTISEQGLDVLLGYGRLILSLIHIWSPSCKSEELCRIPECYLPM